MLGWTAAVVFGDRAGPDPAVAQVRRRVALGVLAAMAALLVLGGLRAIGTTPFAPPDETAHVAYALAISEGQIPDIASFPDDLPIPGMREGLSIWTANHPPGTYVVMAVPLRAGMAIGKPLAGLWLARLLNVVAVAGVVLLSARIVAIMLPHRPRAVVGTAMLVALVPFFVDIAGTAYTDGLALLPVVCLLAVAVEVLIRGPSRARLVALVALSALSSLVRAPAVVLVLFAGIAWGVAQLLHRDGPLGSRLGHAVGGASLLGLGAVVAAGWFYVGNLLTYGDVTGSQALFELHSREPRPKTPWEIITSSSEYRFQQLQLWSKVEGLPEGSDYVISGYFVRGAHQVTKAVLWTTAALTAWHVWRTRLEGQAPLVAAWVLLALWWWALMAMMSMFVSGGGAPHPRYLWPAFPGLALLLVLGLDAWRLPFGLLPADRGAVPRLLRRLGEVPVGLYALFGTLAWANLTGFPRAMELYGLVGPAEDLVRASVGMLAARGIPYAGWVALLAGTVLVAALGTLAWALWATPRRTAVAAVPVATGTTPAAA